MSEANVSVEYVGDDVAVIRLVGEHDLASAPDLRERLESEAVARRVVVDVSDTEFLDSSTINALFQHHEQHGLVLQFGSASVVRRALYITRLLEVVPLAETREEAVRLAREPR
jgi:anti-anti-sigma factor